MNIKKNIRFFTFWNFVLNFIKNEKIRTYINIYCYNISFIVTTELIYFILDFIC